MRRIIEYVTRKPVELVKPYFRKEALRHIFAPDEELLPIGFAEIGASLYGAYSGLTGDLQGAFVITPILMAGSALGIYLGASARRAVKYRFPRLFGYKHSPVTGKKLEKGDTLF